MYNALEKYTRDKSYIRLSEKTNEKNILWTVTILLFLVEWVIEMGYSHQKEDHQKAKIPCKGNESVYIFESCNLWGDMVA